MMKMMEFLFLPSTLENCTTFVGNQHNFLSITLVSRNTCLFVSLAVTKEDKGKGAALSHVHNCKRFAYKQTWHFGGNKIERIV
jgi:hypothetical protein